MCIRDRENVTLEGVQQHHNQIAWESGQTSLTALASGNFDLDSAQKVDEMLLSAFRDRPDSHDSPIREDRHDSPIKEDRAILKLASPCSFLHIRQSSGSGEANNGVGVYFQVGLYSPELHASLWLLLSMYRQHFYRSLRTEQQLGYIVNAGLTIYEEVMFLRFFVQSSEYSCAFLDSCIDVFIQDELPDILHQTSDEDFQKFIAGRKKTLLEPCRTLLEEKSWIWPEIKDGTHRWDRNQLTLNALSRLTPPDIMVCYQKYLNGQACARVALHLQGQAFDPKHGSHDSEALVKSCQTPILIPELELFKQSAQWYEI
eukprot:TRINITY_DN11042_c0_g1_i1.p1 TRINITY_DN11042_c0_g1~~TRINITY_DN11042_c0_g1_i1.p1  ORF type:complete len:315 (-),score=48.39 TRINITY_DN11042_c0_g1_i1:331-1275(-)